MVEMAISMLVFVPIFLYVLMLNDLLFYRLDLQEAVISAQWDLTTRDYEKGIEHGAQVKNAVRLLYCDHSSAYNSYNSGTDCDDASHHYALSAHQCWIQGGAQKNQVNCKRVDKDILSGYMDLGVSSSVYGEISRGDHSGGLYRCDARLAVINDRITAKFLQAFSKVDMLDSNSGVGGGLSKVHHTNNGDLTGDPHGVGDGYFLFPRYRTAILTDTWAINDPVDYDPNSEDTGGTLFKRVRAAYEGPITYRLFQVASLAFIFKAWSKELIMYGMGLDIPDTNLALKHGSLWRTGGRSGVPNGNSTRPGKVQVSEEGSNVSFDVTPWRDWERDRYQRTYEHSERGKWYMGCKNPQSC